MEVGHRGQERRHKEKQVNVMWKPEGVDGGVPKRSVVRYHRSDMHDNTELSSVDLA